MAVVRKLIATGISLSVYLNPIFGQTNLLVSPSDADGVSLQRVFDKTDLPKGKAATTVSVVTPGVRPAGISPAILNSIFASSPLGAGTGLDQLGAVPPRLGAVAFVGPLGGTPQPPQIRRPVGGVVGASGSGQSEKIDWDKVCEGIKPGQSWVCDKVAWRLRKPKKEESDFDKFLKDAKERPGLFTIYEVEPKYIDDGEGIKVVKKKIVKYILEIRHDQLDKDYLYSPTLEKGTGENRFVNGYPGLEGGSMATNFIWYFHRDNDRIQFVRRNTRVRADPGSTAHDLITSTLQDSVITSAKIVGPEHSERHSVLIDMDDIFLGDLEQAAVELSKKYEAGYSFDKEAAHFQSIDNYPENLEISANLTYQSQNSGIESLTLPNPKTVQLTVHYSLSALPGEGFEPRFADERVGNYTESYDDLTDTQESNTWKRLVYHWRLEKVDPSRALSPVKKPIVFYLDKNIPLEYREAVRNGVLAWNQAFEKAGFLGAVQVRDQPRDADWKPGDIRYNMVRWFLDVDGFNTSIGPSRVNPLTGEIYHASIFLSDNMFRITHTETDYASIAKSDPNTDRTQSSCDIGQRLAQDKIFALAALGARGGLTPEDKERFVNQYVTEVVAHEIGHTLGLTHNFEASAAYGLDDINSGKTNGLISASVMDYDVANVALPGKPQGPYFQTKVGPYDEWAIEYAYRDLAALDTQKRKEELEKIADRALDAKELRFGSDDEKGRQDPFVARWDLGDDPLRFRKDRIQLAKDVLKKLGNSQLPGMTPDDTVRNFRLAYNEYDRAIETASRYFGGVRYFRGKRRSSGQAPLEPIAAQKQREALKFLVQDVFREDAIPISDKLFRRVVVITPRRDKDDKSYINYVPEPFSASKLLKELYDSALDGVSGADTLRSIEDTQRLVPAGEQVFTAQELFDTTRRSIWSELDRKGKIVVSDQRQLLQQLHVEKLAGLLNDESAPAGSSALARSSLKQIAKRISSVLEVRSVDPVMRAHLGDVQAKIKHALDLSVDPVVRDILEDIRDKIK